MIAFIGSVFSPWYHWSGRGDPANHCCLNVVLAGAGPRRFTMTDRGRAALRRKADTLQIGPSRMHWTGRELVIDVDEWGAPPMVGPVCGRVVVTPRRVTEAEVVLNAGGAHIWRPFAPLADIRVELSPGSHWEGHGYFDANFGARPLEQDFRTWTWGRYPDGDRALCFYDGVRRDGSHLSLAVEAGPHGLREVPTPPLLAMKRTAWGLKRQTGGDAGSVPVQRLSLLDAPFYSRSTVETQIGGRPVLGVHEALDLDRYRWPWLKPMIALRVPRRAGWP